MTYNPLTRIREEHDLSMGKWAQKLGISPTVVRQHELGCFSKISAKYSPYISTEDKLNYQLFRYEKRRKNFSSYDFPTQASSMQEILDHLGMTYSTFAFAMCLQPGEVYRLTVKDRALVPHNLREAFKQIGLDDEWIANLQYVTIKTPTKHETQTA